MSETPVSPSGETVPSAPCVVVSTASDRALSRVMPATVGRSAPERVLTMFNDLFDEARNAAPCRRCAELERERNEARALVNRILTAPGPTYPNSPIDWTAQ